MGGLRTATRAAAAGGITTLIDMPLNSSPVTTTVAALRQSGPRPGKLWVDVGFHGGVVPGNADQFEPLIEAGRVRVQGVPVPLGHRRVPERRPRPTCGPSCRTLAPRGLPLFVHAELVSPLPPASKKHSPPTRGAIAAYLATRPPEWEVDGDPADDLDLCREYRCPVHIVHLSAAEACR